MKNLLKLVGMIVVAATVVAVVVDAVEAAEQIAFKNVLKSQGPFPCVFDFSGNDISNIYRE